MSEVPDLDRLRLATHPPVPMPSPSPSSSAPRPPPRHRPGEKFLKGPIPWGWLAAAAKRRGAALHVALMIWFWSGLKRSRTVRVSLSRMTELGVSRTAASRGLTELEEAKLVLVSRLPGRNPVVTILNGPED